MRKLFSVAGSGSAHVDAVTCANPDKFAQRKPTILANIESIRFSTHQASGDRS